MKILGYPLTWPTVCFLGCRASVWAHTNGDGDFVLFDGLGSPWPIHSCYQNRSSAGARLQLDEITRRRLEELLAILDDVEERRLYPPAAIHIDAAEWVGKGSFVKRGQVQFYRENRLAHFMRTLPEAELAETRRKFLNRSSELGIVDRGGHVFTFFADLRDTVIAAGAEVEVEIVACRVPIKKLGVVFFCHSLKVVRSI